MKATCIRYTETTVGEWWAVRSGRWLDELRHRRAIRDALDYREATP